MSLLKEKVVTHLGAVKSDKEVFSEETLSTEPETVPVKQGLFKSRDGTTLFYDVRGKGPPLLFCYGLVCKREHWHHQVKYFSDRYQIITFDYRGHQRSSQPANDRNLTLKWCARDIQDLLTHLHIDGVVCLGHSLGVPVAALATRLDERIKASVFICGPVSNPFEHMFYTNRLNKLYRFSAVAYEYLPNTASLIWDFFTKKSKLNFLMTSQLGFNPDTALERDILSYMEGVNQTPFGVFQGFLRDYTRFDGYKVLKEIKVPSLVIAGEDDLITPISIMEKIASCLENGELKIIPDGSHNAHSDFPNEVNAAIEGFLSRIKYL